MAHKLETDHISFGLVTIPVGIYSAIEEQEIRFNQLRPAAVVLSSGDFAPRVTAMSNMMS